MAVSLIIIGLNLLLTTLLIIAYTRMVMKLRTMYTIGLLLFAALFFIHNAVGLYFEITMMQYFAEGLELYVLIFNSLQFVAFTILNYITWR